MAHIMSADVVASFEKYLNDNWPNSSWAKVFTAAEVPSGYADAEGTQWVEVRVLDTIPQQPMRAGEDWTAFDARLLCYARTNDRLDAQEMADEFKALLRGTTIDLIDRTDGTTKLGVIQVHEVGASGAQRDARGAVLAVVDVTGWTETS